MGHISSYDLDAAKRDLSFHLDNLKIRYDLVAEHGLQLQNALDAMENGTDDDMPNLIKTANECATQFRASTNALTVVSTFPFDFFFFLGAVLTLISFFRRHAMIMHATLKNERPPSRDRHFIQFFSKTYCRFIR